MRFLFLKQYLPHYNPSEIDQEKRWYTGIKYAIWTKTVQDTVGHSGSPHWPLINIDPLNKNSLQPPPKWTIANPRKYQNSNNAYFLITMANRFFEQSWNKKICNKNIPVRCGNSVE